MAKLLKQVQQKEASQQLRVPVNNSSADTITSVVGETVQFYYYLAGVLTVDAGQPAGTVVVSKLENNNILTSLGDCIGSNNDTSLVFGTGTILTTLVAFPYAIWEQYSDQSGADRANAITATFTNGQYCIDHESGTIYGKKATVGTSDTGDYLIYQTSGTSGGPTANVNVNQWGGVGTSLGQSTMAASVPVTIASNQSPLDVIPGTFTVITTSLKTVAASGTAEPLVGIATPAKLVEITGLPTNAGNAYIGDSTVDATTNPGIVLSPGQVYGITISNIANIYVDVDTNGEGVSFNYFT